MRRLDLLVHLDVEVDGEARMQVERRRGRANLRERCPNHEVVIERVGDEIRENRAFGTPASWSSQKGLGGLGL